jgi:hypothetical protein
MGVSGRYTGTGIGGNVAAAVATATLPAVLNKTNFLSGFDVTSGGATAAGVVTLTITGLLGGTRSYAYTAVAGATLANPNLILYFDPPLQASGPNVAIVVSMPSLGAGNTNTCVNAQGFLTPPA